MINLCGNSLCKRNKYLIIGRSASTTVLSRPAQGSLTLLPVGLQSTYRELLSLKLIELGERGR
jgi:hypothetical protein